ncbi:hypothetical protein Phi40:1_gp033 [Cellulophaga phage phi40:1]|jgi:hypothetical protein|uniref:Uncharacterized protein n=1 Tax=Cellulophaga phage phi38:1 TaxID=1327977 RepID=S0A1J0_9CAUD|nr:hypothetical protein Phi38:1_gp033 [Cellulophaga phage phi38:1]AGO47898.1 hypothetical protein Phi40:1_gp033 [Cellulophaga phage phi40:1]AGO48063.1 hypothetical protein Phi38:1_gp033 [Cellulophaga phage phi38:1]
MDNELRAELNSIKDYVKKATGQDISTRSRTRKVVFLEALTMYYILSCNYTKASHAEMGMIADGRDRVSVSKMLQRREERVLYKYDRAIKSFNPFSMKISKSNSFLSESMRSLYEARDKLDKEINGLEDTVRLETDYILRQVRNEKVFNILMQLKGLNSEQLSIIEDRLKPIIRMLPKK